MRTNSQRSAILIVAVGLTVGTFLFLIDSRESFRPSFDSVTLGMPVGAAVGYLRDSDGDICILAAREWGSECWFRDDYRGYRIVFDHNGLVAAKYTWRRKPRSLIDRVCNRVGFSVSY